MRLLKIIVLLLPFVSFAQKEEGPRYGAHTTQYFKEEDIIYRNDTSGNSIDTSFTNVHLYEFNLKDKEWKQDLGNIGTAMQPLYYKSPEIGTRMGMNVYDSYAFENEDVKYFDTKSPYTKLYYVQGFRGQQVFDVAFSRNINPRWNFGIEFQRITSKFQYGALEQERETSNYAFQAYTKYSSKDHRYQLLINFTRLDHSVLETGGINDSISENFYLAEEAIPNMFNSDQKTPESSDNRANYHLYHQYDLSGGAQKFNVFHVFDRQKQRTRFRDNELSSNLNYYGKEPQDSTSMDYRLSYQKIDNTLGFRGNAASFFYRAYITHRAFIYNIDRFNWEIEQFYGGDLNYAFNDSTHLDNKIEFSTNKEYSFQSRFFYNELEADFRLKSYSPSLFERTYYGDFEQWDNDFVNIRERVAGIGYSFKYGSQRLKLAYQYQYVKHLTYIDEQGRPQQLNDVLGNSDVMNINSVSSELFLTYKSLHLNNYTRFYDVSGSDKWRAPKWYSKTSLYFANEVFNEVLKFKLGGDFFYKSGYKGYGYDPVIQQFYLQDNVTIGDYPVLDIFLDVNIKVADLFFKMSHVNQGWWGRGYESTPDYIGTRRTFVFGVRWRFYN